jgi:hypothetical protein
MARFANNPPDILRALKFYYEPYGYGLWFLYALFIISMLFYFLGRLQLSREIIFLIAVALHVFSALNLFGFWPMLNTSMGFFLYYALGALLAKPLIFLLKRYTAGPLVCAGILLMGIMTGCQWMGLTWLPLVPMLCGIAGIICIASGIASSVTGPFWVLLGLYSLEIFLGHALFGTASRAVLGRLGVQSPGLYVMCGVGMGIFISLALAMACRKFEFPYLFRWPLNRANAVQKQ